MGFHPEIALRWMPQNLTNKKSTLVRVMAWCHWAPSHNLGQCWPKSLSWYSVNRPQWVNLVRIIAAEHGYIHCAACKELNSLAPGKFQYNLGPKKKQLTSKLILVNSGWGISYEIALRWMPLDLTDDKSTLVQVIAWCRQATSHCLSQCWPRSTSPNRVTRPQWVIKL